MSIIDLFRTRADKKALAPYEKIAKQVIALEDEFENLSNEDLAAQTNVFKERLAKGEGLDDILVESFALVREAAYRTLGMKHYPVQIVAGAVMHHHMIAEMKTGEGKTLASTLVIYLHALEGKGVHVATANDYLAKRDCEWMSPVYKALGLTADYISQDRIISDRRRAAYMADITYGTCSQFGFDHLRDNMAKSLDEKVQRDHHFALIDEVDSILIDEARTPLILSGPSDKSYEDDYKAADKFIRTLSSNDVDHNIREGYVVLTDKGILKAEKYFGTSDYSSFENLSLQNFITQALRAHYIMKRGHDYIVTGSGADQEVKIVDLSTGRTMEGRRFAGGLHQAIETKENTPLKSETKTWATITLQNYFKLYPGLCGMTGTAKTEEEEFIATYNLRVLQIPTHKPIQRIDEDDSIFITEEAKFIAIVEEVKKVHATGQPILVGTSSVRSSEILSALFTKRKIPHEVLNAKNPERESEIISQAGRKGAVTIATNMAGRGTDIVLGGDFKKRALDQIQIQNIPMNTDESALIFENEKLIFEKEHEEILSLGGLCVLGSERHESRRIDNQLRGRSGRQGDPGRSKFYVSFKDELMTKNLSESAEAMLSKFTEALQNKTEAISGKLISRQIEQAQKIAEGKNYAQRKYTVMYDDVLNTQRQVVYQDRDRVLASENVREIVLRMISTVIKETVRTALSGESYASEFNLLEFKSALRATGYQITDEAFDSIDFIQAINNGQNDDFKITNDFVEANVDTIKDLALKDYESRMLMLKPEQTAAIENFVVLSSVDRNWIEHIDAMEQLKDALALHAMAGKDPLVQYKLDGFELFERTMFVIQEEVCRAMMLLDPEKLNPSSDEKNNPEKDSE